MGFLNGRVTFLRYRVGGDSPLPFGPEHLEAIERHAIGKNGHGESTDGVSIGWVAGDHVLDMNFSLEKTIIDDALHLALRIDTDKIPGDLLKAYTKIELDARAAANPSGKPTKAQREEAKEAAKVRAEAEAADGRFRRRKSYPLLWDGRNGLLYVGTHSASVIDRLLPLFRETFNVTVEPISAGSLASDQAQARGVLKPIEDLAPASFHGDEMALAAFAWSSETTTPDYWGNEFLVWLWHTLKADGDTIRLSDGSEITVMLAKTLTLDCPRGETGRDSMTDAGPTRLPEAFRALQSGKLPRKAGLILVRHGQQYELTMQAETLAVSGLALPKIEGASGYELHVARVEALRHLVESLELLFEAYGMRRTGPEWNGDLGRIRAWLTAA